MEEFKHIFKILLNIIEKIGPTLATLTAVYLGYIYAKKHRITETKIEEYKKIRIIISELILIWRELSLIEYHTSSNEFYVNLISKNTKEILDFFELDTNKIKKFKNLYNLNKENLKSINVSLFYNLEKHFTEFDNSLNNLNYSSRDKVSDEEFNKLILEFFKENIRDLENLILSISDYLPKKEKKEIEYIIAEHHNELYKENYEIEIPDFLINIINENLPTIENISKEEVELFMNNQTVKLIISKIPPKIYMLFINKNPLKTIEKIYSFTKNPEQFEDKLDYKDLLISIKINNEDDLMFRNNITFYKLICGLYKKFDTKIPISFKRYLLLINNGKISIKKELENLINISA